MSAGYWRARLRDLRIGYALLPVQLAQLSALERCVEEIERRAKAIVPVDERRVA